MAWSKGQAKEFVKRARKRYGATWEHVGSDLREAMIAQAYAGVVSSQAVDSVVTDDLTQLWRDMCEVAGLTDDDEQIGEGA